MKKILFTVLLTSIFTACTSEAKIDKEEEQQREVSDQIQKDKDQQLLDSIMKAEEEKTNTEQ